MNDFLKDVGGLFTSIFFISRTVYQFFSIPLYYSSLIQDAFFVKKSKHQKAKADDES